MADDEKKTGIHVCSPNLLTASREEKDIYIKVIDNYSSHYERQIEEQAEVQAG